jgi:FtsH-binding integral membrane protein
MDSSFRRNDGDGYMTPMNPTLAAIAHLAPSLAMLAVFALTGGGLWLILKRRDRRKGALMLVAALVLLGNVLIWTWPYAQ